MDLDFWDCLGRGKPPSYKPKQKINFRIAKAVCIQYVQKYSFMLTKDEVSFKQLSPESYYHYQRIFRATIMKYENIYSIMLLVEGCTV